MCIYIYYVYLQNPLRCAKVSLFEKKAIRITCVGALPLCGQRLASLHKLG